MSAIPAMWHKSSYSNQTGGHCVEVSESVNEVYVRDTQHREIGHLSFPAEAWTAFLEDIKLGRL